MANRYFTKVNIKEITNKQIKEIFVKLLSYTDKKYSKNFLKEKNWKDSLTWTKEQEQEFKLWLKKFLTKQNEVQKHCLIDPVTRKVKNEWIILEIENNVEKFIKIYGLKQTN